MCHVPLAWSAAKIFSPTSTDAAMGFDAHTCAVLNTIQRQSPNIAMGVDIGASVAPVEPALRTVAANPAPEAEAVQLEPADEAVAAAAEAPEEAAEAPAEAPAAEADAKPAAA
mgnify:CR=1 FL=1